MEPAIKRVKFNLQELHQPALELSVDDLRKEIQSIITNRYYESSFKIARIKELQGNYKLNTRKYLLCDGALIALGHQAAREDHVWVRARKTSYRYRKLQPV